VVVQQVVLQATSNGTLPMLTRTSYVEWALLMKVHLQAHGWWEAVATENASYDLSRGAQRDGHHPAWSSTRRAHCHW
jgi:hypothetical protein